jgi:hypothetical protein
MSPLNEWVIRSWFVHLSGLPRSNLPKSMVYCPKDGAIDRACPRKWMTSPLGESSHPRRYLCSPFTAGRVCLVRSIWICHLRRNAGRGVKWSMRNFVEIP